MSAKVVQSSIRQAVWDGSGLSDEEAAKIVSKKDGWFSEPESLGTYTDAYEHTAVTNLYNSVVSGSVKASPKARAMLRDVVEEGRTDKGVVERNVLKGAAIGAAVGIWSGPGEVVTIGGGVLLGALFGMMLSMGGFTDD
jgi:hypothetical protein